MSDEAGPRNSAEPPQYSFNDLGLQVGSRLQLELPASRDKRGHFTVLIGYSPGETVLVRTPLLNGMPLTVVEGETIIVRAFSGVTAFAFTSSVDKVCREPYSYLHLAFPTVIRGSRVRSALRVRVSLQGTAKAGGKTVPVTVLNLSATGALVEGENELGKEGDPVDVSFAFVLQPGDEEINFSAGGTIRNATHAAGGDATRYGVEFGNLDRTRRLELQAMVYQVALQTRDSIT